MNIAFIEAETDNSIYENAELCIDLSDFLGSIQFRVITNSEEAKALAFNILDQLNINNMFINYTVHTIIHYKNIDMSLFFKLASINYDMYNKFVKEQNKQNTKDPEIKILGFDEYLNENQKE